jgi:hypothetical protein
MYNILDAACINQLVLVLVDERGTKMQSLPLDGPAISPHLNISFKGAVNPGSRVNISLDKTWNGKVFPRQRE